MEATDLLLLDFAQLKYEITLMYLCGRIFISRTFTFDALGLVDWLKWFSACLASVRL
jgi:hypothetical protein